MCRRLNRHLASPSMILQHSLRIPRKCVASHVRESRTLPDLYHAIPMFLRQCPVIAAVGAGRYNAGHGAGTLR